jgi:hypothetical protein
VLLEALRAEEDESVRASAAEVLGGLAPTQLEVAEALVGALAPSLGGPPRRSGLSEVEQAAADRLHVEKYLQPAWTLRR